MQQLPDELGTGRQQVPAFVEHEQRTAAEGVEARAADVGLWAVTASNSTDHRR